MNKYPDNVIEFPVSQRPAKKKMTSAQPEQISPVPFLKEMIEVIDKIEGKDKAKDAHLEAEHRGDTSSPMRRPVILPDREQYQNQFLSLKPLKELDFDLFENKDTVEDSEVLDRYLVALSTEIGPVATRKLARAIEEYVAEVADIAFAEGLTEGAIPLS